MARITKRERRRIYTQMLFMVFLSHKMISDYRGLCSALFTVTEGVSSLEELPELIAGRPEHRPRYGYWWPRSKKGLISRMQCLEEAITQLDQPKTKQHENTHKAGQSKNDRGRRRR